MAIKAKHTKLSRKIGTIWKAQKGKPAGEWVTFIEASGHWLERMNLPKETLAKAKELAAHEIRLIQVEKGNPVSVKIAVKILETIERGIPAFIKRHEETFTEQQKANLRMLKADIQKKLPQIKRIPKEKTMQLPSEIVQTASFIQSSELHELLGTKKYDLYRRGMGRTMKALSKA